MEKILIGIDTENIDLRPCIHALNLAERMKRVKIYFLLVSDTSKIKSNHKNKVLPDTMNKKKFSTKENLESLIEDGRSKGIRIGYYAAEGEFKNEIINFIKSRRIDLLIIGSPRGKTRVKKEDTFTEFIGKIKHRVDCRIEVVHGKC